MFDLFIQNVTWPDGRTLMSLAVQSGLIVEVAPGLDVPAHEVIDAQGFLRDPPFVVSISTSTPA